MVLPGCDAYVQAVQDASGQVQAEGLECSDSRSGDDDAASPSREQVLRELLDEAHARIRTLEAALEALRSWL